MSGTAREVALRALHIVHWHESHESAESRKLVQPWWVPKPNKHDGMAYSRLTKEPDALALYGAWTAIVEVCSKGPRETRGWLIRNGRALNADDLADLTRFPKPGFERVLEFCQRPEIGWLLDEEFAVTESLPGLAPAGPGGPPGSPGDAPAGPGHSAGLSPANPPPKKERQTERETGKQKGSEEEGGGGRNGQRMRPPSLKEMFAALQDQVRQMERRKEELTPEERAELRKKKRRLELVQEAQAAGRTEVAAE